MRRFLLGVFFIVFTTFASAEYTLVPVVEEIDTPWAVTSVGDNKLLVSVRKGELLLVSNLDTSPTTVSIAFAPDDLYFAGQGGLLDLKLHPDYSENYHIYVSYSAGTEQANYLKVVRIKLDLSVDVPVIKDITPIFEVKDRKNTPVHFAGRMAFDTDGNLLLTSGDGFDFREKAQVLHSHLGKILRMTEDGEPVANNAFFDAPDMPQNFIFSRGHRNHQGLLVLPDGTIISHEHGPDGGDEVNIIENGNNYGWPVITEGMDYIGATISPFREYPGMLKPKVNWTPSIAPSGMVYYTGSRFPELQDKFLITSLKFKRVYVLARDFSPQSDLFTENNQRLRDITSSANGEIYILTDGANATLYRVSD